MAKWRLPDISRIYVQCCGSGSGTRNPGSGAFLTPGSGIRDGKNQYSDPGSGSGMNNPDPISESLETIFCAQILNSLMRIWDPGSGIEKFRSGIRDGKNSGPGSGIRDKHPGSRTLFTYMTFTVSHSCIYIDLSRLIQVHKCDISQEISGHKATHFGALKKQCRGSLSGRIRNCLPIRIRIQSY